MIHARRRAVDVSILVYSLVKVIRNVPDSSQINNYRLAILSYQIRCYYYDKLIIEHVLLGQYFFLNLFFKFSQFDLFHKLYTKIF